MSIVTLLLILANLAMTYQGFQDRPFFERYKFSVDHILVRGDWKRMVSSGFLHVNWMHFAFNMFTLYNFGPMLERSMGLVPFVIIYTLSLLAGNALSLYFNRNHGDYSAVGASGAVSGVIYAAITITPGMSLSIFFIPGIPAWVFGLVYTIYTIYGIQSKRDNIGHEAHFGGALLGMIAGIVFFPESLTTNYWAILCISVPSVVFLVLLLLRPHMFLLNKQAKQGRPKEDADHTYNLKRTQKQEEINQLLEKVAKRGMVGLTKKERERLDELSQ